MIRYVIVFIVKMPIDKSWIHLKNQLSNQYQEGLSAFINIAKDYVDKSSCTNCPCPRCSNHKCFLVETVRAHIHQYGFNPLYTTWYYHGEYDVMTNLINESVDEMVAVINDVVGNNSDHDMSEEVEADVLGDAQHDEFKELLSKLESALYPGCTKYSSLNFLVKLMHLKVLYKWPYECMNSVLKLMKDTFPEGIKLPDSYYEAKKKLSKLGLDYKTIYVCKYDCALF